MNTIIFLIIVSTGNGPARVEIKEMPNLRLCEGVGKSVDSSFANMSKGGGSAVRWNCIEGPRG